MGLFYNKEFREVIFLKANSELQNKVNKLQELKNKGLNSEKLEKDFLLSNIGLQGEKEIEYELKNANIGMYVLHDIFLQYQNLSAQIDYVIVTAARIYFIECKNLVGNITVNENGDFIREYVFNNKKIKEGMYSPYSQAKRHIEIYHRLWSKSNGGLFSQMREKQFDFWNIPLVVCANTKNILNTKYAPKDIKKRIIKSDQLIRMIRYDIENTEKNNLDSQANMEKRAQYILSLNNEKMVDYDKLYENEIQEEQIDTKALKEKLIEYRKQKSKQMNVPAYYVFTNEELNDLLSLLPKKIDDLKSLKILPTVKIKLYGQDIINIIEKNIMEII